MTHFTPPHPTKSSKVRLKKGFFAKFFQIPNRPGTDGKVGLCEDQRRAGGDAGRFMLITAPGCFAP
ncbi:MAG: hypothetical protein A3G75_09870 [Verrucomicrobia bacterium RIFCSPLOWO2_12_FULL_64_8]|nr:MAG: hypothetical protein A3G75_09870 [Verrucomicrobia bacterium RIFCSPLOWO2_12_FULL_64_8]